MLELAYWISPVPGQIPGPVEESYYRLSEFRDSNPSLNDPYAIDRWVVFHLHFNASTSMEHAMFTEQVSIDPIRGGGQIRTFTNIVRIDLSSHTVGSSRVYI